MAFKKEMRRDGIQKKKMRFITLKKLAVTRTSHVHTYTSHVHVTADVECRADALHTYAGVCWRMLTSAYVSIRQHTSNAGLMPSAGFLEASLQALRHPTLAALTSLLLTKPLCY